MIPRVRLCQQGSSHDIDGAVASAYYELADSIPRAFLDYSGRSQPGSTRKASGTSFQACIALSQSMSCTADSPATRTGIKDQLGSHAAFILDARFLVMDFFHAALSFGPKLIASVSIFSSRV